MIHVVTRNDMNKRQRMISEYGDALRMITVDEEMIKNEKQRKLNLCKATVDVMCCL